VCSVNEGPHWLLVCLLALRMLLLLLLIVPYSTQWQHTKQPSHANHSVCVQWFF
jgi:hypothetical protein